MTLIDVRKQKILEQPERLAFNLSISPCSSGPVSFLATSFPSFLLFLFFTCFSLLLIKNQSFLQTCMLACSFFWSKRSISHFSKLQATNSTPWVKLKPSTTQLLTMDVNNFSINLLKEVRMGFICPTSGRLAFSMYDIIESTFLRRLPARYCVCVLKLQQERNCETACDSYLVL